MLTPLLDEFKQLGFPNVTAVEEVGAMWWKNAFVWLS